MIGTNKNVYRALARAFEQFTVNKFIWIKHSPGKKIIKPALKRALWLVVWAGDMSNFFEEDLAAFASLFDGNRT